VHWSRPDRTPFIPNGAPGEFDDASIYAGVGVLRQGDELWMYYSASRGRHNQNYPKWLSYHGVYTRAILTLDRYVGLQANLAPAEFVTLPLTFSGNRLELNADCGPAAEHWPAGAIRVELQEPDGTPIPGFALDECQPVVGDSVRHTVSWKAGADVGSRAGKPTRMRCVATDATLFAFQFARRQ
jgi:hypothetical protein